MEASVPTPRACRSRTAPMSLLQALPSSTQKIMAKRSGNCGALDSACHPSLRRTLRWSLPILARTRQRLSILSCLRSNDRPGFLGRLGHNFVSLRDSHYLFDSCFALRDTPPAILPQRFHAFGNGALLEFAAVAFLHDQFS